MASLFCTISGFQPDTVKRLAPGAYRQLWLDSAWAVIGLLLCGVSAAYLFWFCTYSWLNSLTVGLLVVAILFALQGLVNSGTGLDYSKVAEKQKAWRPNPLYAGSFFLLTLIFSQPLLIYLHSEFDSGTIQVTINEGKALRLELYKNSRKVEEDTLQSRLAALTEALSQHDNVAPIAPPTQPVEADIAPATHPDGRRKALLIGNQSYPSAPLNNPRKDAHDLSAALKNIGFSVTEISDGTRKTMELAIDSYIKSLKPGDISVLYYSGHGFQYLGNNYLVGVDFTGFKSPKVVGLNMVIESISARSPQASVIIIDACRTFSMGAAMGGAGGLAQTEAGINTYIALAAKPGQSAQDNRPGTNGFFTAALLHNISRPVDINEVFRAARTEVAEQTHNRQETWSTDSLRSNFVLASADAVRATEKPEQVNVNGHGAAALTEDPASCESQSKDIPESTRLQWLRECFGAGITRLQDDLIEHQNMTQTELARMEQISASKELSASNLLTALRSLWSHPYRHILESIFLALFLSGGFIHRYFRPEALLEYKRALHSTHRNYILGALKEYRHKAENSPYAPPSELIKMGFTQDDPHTQVDRSIHAAKELYSYWLSQPSKATA